MFVKLCLCSSDEHQTKDISTFLRDVKTVRKELEACDTELAVYACRVLNARKKQTSQSCVRPHADPRKDSTSGEHLDSPVNLEDEARKVIAKIRELRDIQYEEKSCLEANVQSMLGTLDSICDIKTEEKLPLSDYLQISANERAVRGVLKEVTDFQGGWHSSVDRLIEFAELFERKLQIVGENAKDEVAPKEVTGRHKGSRKQLVSKNTTTEVSQAQSEGPRKQPAPENETPEISKGQREGPRKQHVPENKTPEIFEGRLEGPRKQSENETTAIPEGQIKRPYTRKKAVYRSSGDDADASNPKANSAPVAKLVEELHNLCELLQLICEHGIATQPTVSASFILCANAYGFHAKQCLHLAQTSFLFVAFSSQLLSAMVNLIDSFTASNAKEIEAKELISAVRQLTVTVPLLQSKFQHLYSDYLFRATCPATPELAALWARYKETGTDWRTNAICKHLDTAEEVLEEATVKLNEALSDYDIASSSSSSSDSDFEKVDLTEGFLAIARKMTSIGDTILSLANTKKV